VSSIAQDRTGFISHLRRVDRLFVATKPSSISCPSACPRGQQNIRLERQVAASAPRISIFVFARLRIVAICRSRLLNDGEMRHANSARPAC
jgi:hypothetical protein